MNIRNALWILACLFAFSSCIKEDIENDSSDAIANFDLLWKTVDENYCFFEEKGVDWNTVRDKYRPMVTTAMSDTALFAICSSMLNELKDGHVNLYSNFNTSRYWDWFLDYPQNFNWSIVERNYLGKNCLIAGRLKAQKIRNVAYLRFESFSDVISYANVKKVFAQMGDVNGAIIDIRDNGGGYVSMSEEFASCFFPEKKLVAYEKYKEGPGHSDFSNFFPQYIDPDSTVIFTGKIVVLTNHLVFSSANYFVSMMKTLPNVTIIGDVTGGGGGLPFSSELYNGWQVRLSRNPIVNANKESIENGIQPDKKVNMNKIDEGNGFDSIIEFALDFIDGQKETD
ncbi:MAG TPA: S41 family peptidase [Prolixibacteraceae bacterium]|nr:S41 family peptidase [Prolixibacteraceae bacterium]HPS11736.1 S41 family peptidase [Prolixibacteraceae bacterium]